MKGLPITPLTKAFQFTLALILDLAGKPPGTTAPQVNTTARLGIPGRYLEPILQRLVKTKILRGIRGPKGGYSIGRPLEDITLADIQDAVDSPAKANYVDTRELSPLGRVVSSTAARITAKWNADLRSITLAKLLNRAPKT